MNKATWHIVQKSDTDKIIYEIPEQNNGQKTRKKH